MLPGEGVLTITIKGGAKGRATCKFDAIPLFLINIFSISVSNKMFKLNIPELFFVFFFQAEDGIRDRSPSRGLGDVYKRQTLH